MFSFNLLRHAISVILQTQNELTHAYFTANIKLKCRSTFWLHQANWLTLSKYYAIDVVWSKSSNNNEYLESEYSKLSNSLSFAEAICWIHVLVSVAIALVQTTSLFIIVWSSEFYIVYVNDFQVINGNIFFWFVDIKIVPFKLQTKQKKHFIYTLLFRVIFFALDAVFSCFVVFFDEIVVNLT